MPAIKVANPKVSPELVQELQDESAYQNIKAFSATHAFLRRLIRFSCDKEYAGMPAKVIQEQFDNYDVPYTPCLDALVRHGLIEIDRQYIVGVKTRGYKLTEHGARLMYQGQMQYLKDLFTDPKLRRQMQKRESYHRNKAREYQDDFLHYIHEGRMQYQYSQDAVNLIERSDWEMLTKADAMNRLTDFSERNFTVLKYNEKSDNRVWNEFVGMKSDLRRFFSHGDLKYRYVMDIRSCHPLFLGHYLVHQAKRIGYGSVNPMIPGEHHFTIVQLDERQKKASEASVLSFPSTTPTFPPLPNPTISSNPSISSSTIIPIPHYDGGNSDIQAELERWNDLFTDPDTDPKAVLNRDLGYSRETAKAALNHSINGSRKYRKFIAWFKQKFPLLHGVWERTSNPKVGVNISMGYETPLMQDKTLYRLATKLGLHLTYEYDGCGIMCRENDEQALAKIQQLVQHIQDLSDKRWSIRPVLVVKTAQGEEVKLPAEATSATEGPKKKSCDGGAQSIPKKLGKRQKQVTGTVKG